MDRRVVRFPIRLPGGRGDACFRLRVDCQGRRCPAPWLTRVPPRTALDSSPGQSASRPRPLLSESRYVAATLTVIVLAGLAIRTYQLATRSLWFDEAFSWRLIEFPFLEMLQRIGRDSSPPLHFILLQGWAAVFGESAFALRSLSVLFGVLTIVGVYLFAVEAFGRDYQTVESNSDLRTRGRGIGLLAAALVALSVFQIRYSQELRMYLVSPQVNGSKEVTAISDKHHGSEAVSRI